MKTLRILQLKLLETSTTGEKERSLQKTTTEGDMVY